MWTWWKKSGARLAVLLAAILTASASYVVQPGDTISSIARQLGLDVTRLVEMNGLRDPNLIVAGQVLKTDQGSHSPTGDLGGATHVVQRGESLAGIALRHGVDVETLVKANGIVGGRVFAGFRLRLVLPTHEFAADTSSTIHTVVPGETIASIAQDHGVESETVLGLNHIHDVNHLEPGAGIVIDPGWVCPVPGGTFSNDWGYVKPSGSTHDGIDIFAARGDQVLAPVAGHVHQETGRFAGLQVTLFGEDGVTYIGSHLTSFGVSGDVNAGDILGGVGNSGNASGTSPHLHFEAHPAGEISANPYPVLLETCS